MFNSNKEELSECLFMSISILKKSYDEISTKGKTFLEFLEHALGYLTELVSVMQENWKIPYIYQPWDESNIYGRFFCESYNKKFFESEEEFNDYRFGFKGVRGLINIQRNDDKSFIFSISNQILFNYLYATNPCEIFNKIIRSIAESVESGATNEFVL